MASNSGIKVKEEIKEEATESDEHNFVPYNVLPLQQYSDNEEEIQSTLDPLEVQSNDSPDVQIINVINLNNVQNVHYLPVQPNLVSSNTFHVIYTNVAAPVSLFPPIPGSNRDLVLEARRVRRLAKQRARRQLVRAQEKQEEEKSRKAALVRQAEMYQVPNIKCFVPFCSTISTPTQPKRTFPFPTDGQQKIKWLTNILWTEERRQEFLENCEDKAYEIPMICAEHFESEDFLPGYFGSKKVLRKDAVPTRFFDHQTQEDNLIQMQDCRISIKKLSPEVVTSTLQRETTFIEDENEMSSSPMNFNKEIDTATLDYDALPNKPVEEFSPKTLEILIDCIKTEDIEYSPPPELYANDDVDMDREDSEFLQPSSSMLSIKEECDMEEEDVPEEKDPTYEPEEKPAKPKKRNIKRKASKKKRKTGNSSSRRSKASNYTCEECNISFNFSGGLKQHVQAIHLKVQFKCHLCEHLFSKPGDVKRHISKSCPFIKNMKQSEIDNEIDKISKVPIVNPEKRIKRDSKKKSENGEDSVVGSTDSNFICEECNISFSFKGSLKKHIQTVHLKVQFKCHLCQNFFSNPCDVKRHISKSCPFIKNMTQSEIENEIDKISKVPIVNPEKIDRDPIENDKSTFACPCGMTFPRSINRLQHFRKCSKGLGNLKRIGKKLCCPEPGCNAQIPFKRMEAHLNEVHRNLRPYSCFECKQTFPSRYSLANHTRRRHKPPKQYEFRYPCPVCEVKSNSKTEALRHAKQIHNLEKEELPKTFVCQSCGFTDSFVVSLKHHLRNKHGEEQPSICSVCGKTLSTDGKRISHMMRVHGINERDTNKISATTFICPSGSSECSQLIFVNLEQFDYHLKDRHHKQRVIKCEASSCTKTFGDRIAWKKHLRAAHFDIKDKLAQLIVKQTI